MVSPAVPVTGTETEVFMAASTLSSKMTSPSMMTWTLTFWLLTGRSMSTFWVTSLGALAGSGPLLICRFTLVPASTWV